MTFSMPPAPSFQEADEGALDAVLAPRWSAQGRMRFLSRRTASTISTVAEAGA